MPSLPRMKSERHPRQHLEVLQVPLVLRAVRSGRVWVLGGGRHSHLPVEPRFNVRRVRFGHRPGKLAKEHGVQLAVVALHFLQVESQCRWCGDVRKEISV